MDFCAVKKRYAGFAHHRSSTKGPRLDGIRGVLRLLADVALKTLVSYRMFPENKERQVFDGWQKQTLVKSLTGGEHN